MTYRPRSKPCRTNSPLHLGYSAANQYQDAFTSCQRFSRLLASDPTPYGQNSIRSASSCGLLTEPHYPSNMTFRNYDEQDYSPSIPEEFYGADYGICNSEECESNLTVVMPQSSYPSFPRPEQSPSSIFRSRSSNNDSFWPRPTVSRLRTDTDHRPFRSNRSYTNREEREERHSDLGCYTSLERTNSGQVPMHAQFNRLSTRPYNRDNTPSGMTNFYEHRIDPPDNNASYIGGRRSGAQ